MVKQSDGNEIKQKNEKISQQKVIFVPIKTGMVKTWFKDWTSCFLR